MTSIAAAACSWMTDESAEFALLTAVACDLQSQMTIADANDKMEDGHLIASLRAVISSGWSYNGCPWEHATRGPSHLD